MIPLLQDAVFPHGNATETWSPAYRKPPNLQQRNTDEVVANMIYLASSFTFHSHSVTLPNPEE